MSKILSPRTKRNISRIIPFGIIWLVSGMVFGVVERAVTEDLDNHPIGGIEMTFEVFVFSSLAITFVGLLVGAVETLYLNKLLAKKSFVKKIFYKIIFYTLLLFLVTLITYPIAASLELETNVFDQRVLSKFYGYLKSAAHLSTDLQLVVALGASLFYSEISENIGHGVLMNFFTGKYHTPLEEKRIFMFLDMKSSTSIAEKLGHIKYFELLREYYNDLSAPIIDYSGEVYQYVGDEIIVSWKYGDGVANNNCIKCFFAMKEELKKRADWYNQKFHLTPTFKAGLHYGKVTTGEIGALKKEIIFTGDVLNATARIQGLCNQYNVDILISEDLMKNLNMGSEFQVRSLGKKELRGKKENVALYSIF